MQSATLNDPFLPFRNFTDPNDAEVISSLLVKHHIEIEVEDETGLADFTKPFNVLTGMYRLNIRANDFARADEIITQYYTSQIGLADPSYFLFQFTDEELIDVIIKSDEWGDYNALLAKSILAKKGIVIPDEMSQGLRKKRIEELRKPEQKAEIGWLVYAYIFSLLFGGFLGIVIGGWIARGKKTLPNGERVYIFSNSTRVRGYWMLAVGLIIFLTLITLHFLQAYEVYSVY